MVRGRREGEVGKIIRGRKDGICQMGKRNKEGRWTKEERKEGTLKRDK